MRGLIRSTFGVLGLIVAAGPALAQIPSVIDPQPPSVWPGLHLATLGQLYADDEGPGYGGALTVGYDFAADRFVVGFEVGVAATAYNDDYYSPDYATVDIVARARAGVVLGDRDQLLLYGVIGYGRYFSTTDFSEGYVVVGGGAEIMVADQLGIRLELAGYRYPAGDWGRAVSAGLVWHLD